MNATELLNRIIASGADETGISDRFGSNVDLYARCFGKFMEEPYLTVLRDTIRSQNYEKAFEAAHALKGLAGNLGINGYYNAIRTLTNTLRDAEYDDIDEEYAEVERQLERLRRIVSDGPTSTQETVPQNPPQAEEIPARLINFRSLIRDKNNRFYLRLLGATLTILTLVGLMFGLINRSHYRNVLAESGQHLTEISNQIRLYVEDQIAIDWKIAQSVGDSILSSSYVDDDPAVYEMLQKKQRVWGVSDLTLYTQNGYCVYADGSTEATDIASMTVYNARKDGKSLSIVDSRLLFTVPLDTTLTFHGAEIVAISVVRDIATFLDEMTFSSFDNSAWLYLTDQNGVILSSLSGPSTIQAFSIQAVIEGMEITPLDKTVTENFIFNPHTSAFLLSDASSKLYAVSAPIMTESEPLRLFYFVPENAVNNIMSGFSRQLMIISMSLISLLAIVAYVAFMFVYKSRKKLFDQSILTREKMFDLLIRNTRTAFGLFSLNQSQPEYLSANATEVTGESYWILGKTDAGYQIHNAEGIETENITLVNDALREWDGKSLFHSGYLCNKQNATPSYFVFELYPVYDGANDFVGIAQDFTLVYIREEAVKRAMESAKQANNAKSNFLSSMSHDIRTPMNAIMNMSNFALESLDQPKKLRDYLRLIHESAEHLLHLVNDVLDMSRIESGQLVVASAPFDIREEIQRQVGIIQPLCSAKNQTLITDFSGLKQTMVYGDALKLSQIAINLLSNATKFTPEKGAVRFTAEEIPALREDFVTVRFIVEDNGIGISEADIKHIFEPFNRSNDKEVSKIAGTGLGLAIVKNYVDAMGGTIHCESELKEGSVFTVELSIQKADSSIDHVEPNTALTDVSFTGMHALVAEDNQTNQIIAKEMLERMGFILDFVDDGSEAVRIFRESRPYTYDVIYMDIQMPVMNGFAAATEIRASDHLQAKEIPIIAMTANAFAEDIEKARIAGMDGYVSKPIVSSELVEQTKKVIDNKRVETK